MHFSRLALFLAALAPAALAQSSLRLEVPSTGIVCQPAALRWSGTTGTVYIRAIIGEGEGVVSTTDASMNMAVTTQENAASSGSYAWTVALAPGTKVTFSIADSTGQTNYSSAMTITGDNTCNAPANFSGASASSSSGSGSGSGSSSTASSGGSSSSRTSGTAAPAATTTTRPSGALGSAAARGPVALSAGAALVGAVLYLA